MTAITPEQVAELMANSQRPCKCGDDMCSACYATSVLRGTPLQDFAELIATQAARIAELEADCAHWQTVSNNAYAQAFDNGQRLGEMRTRAEALEAWQQQVTAMPTLTIGFDVNLGPYVEAGGVRKFSGDACQVIFRPEMSDSKQLQAIPVEVVA